MTRGRAPDGGRYWPAFPYTAFTNLREQELADLWAYLQTIPPDSRADTPHDLPALTGSGLALRAWRGMYFDPATDAERDALDTGAYLGEGIGHCAECHSPRNGLGAIKRRHPLSGSSMPPEPAPNITPSGEGIGGWDAGDAAWFLESGMTPSGDVVGGEMYRITTEGTAALSAEERAALADWLLGHAPWPDTPPPSEDTKEEDSDDEPWM